VATPDSVPALAVAVNIPAYRLDVRDGDSTWSYRVAVGTRRYPTPRGVFRVREVVWNPWWVPPPSDWARDARVTPPGPDNPMGRVKLRVTELVFLHGTPLVGSLGRATSHACVRLANADAVALARLVHRRALPEVPDSVVDAALADSTRPVRLAVRRPVPVTLRYEVVEVRRDTLWVYPDVYGLGRATPGGARRVLAAAGVDTVRADRAALARAVAAGVRTTTGVALADLAPEEER
jgi:murein L,D-transpeptidase YcbB/YkuD